MSIFYGCAFCICIYCFFFALLSISRFSVALGFFDRSLFAGLICSLCLGDFSLATSFIMPVAIFYEILWIDLFPAGTYVAPNGTLPFLLVFCFAYVSGMVDGILPVASEIGGQASIPSRLLMLMILAMPMATWAANVEMFLRRSNDARYDKLVHWLGLPQSEMSTEEGCGEGLDEACRADCVACVSADFAIKQCPRTLIVAALFQSVLIYMMSFAVCLFVLFVTFWCLEKILRLFPDFFFLFDDANGEILTWPMLWFAALVGCLLALRIKKAYIAYGVTVCVLFLSFFFLK